MFTNPTYEQFVDDFLEDQDNHLERAKMTSTFISCPYIANLHLTQWAIYYPAPAHLIPSTNDTVSGDLPF